MTRIRIALHILLGLVLLLTFSNSHAAEHSTSTKTGVHQFYERLGKFVRQMFEKFFVWIVNFNIVDSHNITRRHTDCVHVDRWGNFSHVDLCDTNQCPGYKVISANSSFELRLYENAKYIGINSTYSSPKHFYHQKKLAFLKLATYFYGHNVKKIHLNYTVPLFTQFFESPSKSGSKFRLSLMVPVSPPPDVLPLSELFIFPDPSPLIYVKKFPGNDIDDLAAWRKRASDLIDQLHSVKHEIVSNVWLSAEYLLENRMFLSCSEEVMIPAVPPPPQ